MIHLQDKWIKNTKENQRRKNSQPVGKAKNKEDRSGDQLLEIAGWKIRFRPENLKRLGAKIGLPCRSSGGGGSSSSSSSSGGGSSSSGGGGSSSSSSISSSSSSSGGGGGGGGSSSSSGDSIIGSGGGGGSSSSSSSGSGSSSRYLRLPVVTPRAPNGFV